MKNNEQTQSLCIVHACTSEEDMPAKLRENVHLLDSIYPKLRIDLVVVHAEFGPRLIKWLAKELGIPTNMVRGGGAGSCRVACVLCASVVVFNGWVGPRSLDVRHTSLTTTRCAWRGGAPARVLRCSSRAPTRSSASSSTRWAACA